MTNGLVVTGQSSFSSIQQKFMMKSGLATQQHRTLASRNISRRKLKENGYYRFRNISYGKIFLDLYLLTTVEDQFDLYFYFLMFLKAPMAVENLPFLEHLTATQVKVYIFFKNSPFCVDNHSASTIDECHLRAGTSTAVLTKRDQFVFHVDFTHCGTTVDNKRCRKCNVGTLAELNLNSSRMPFEPNNSLSFISS